MKIRFLLVVFIMAFMLFSNGQEVNGVNAGELFVVKCNYLYSGVDNPVKVIYKGKILAPNEYDANISWGVCKKTDTGLIINSNGTAVICITGKGGDTIYCNQLHMKGIPAPQITVNGKLRGGIISKRSLLMTNGVVALIENFNFAVRYNVKSYSATFHIGNETTKLFCVGPLFSPEVLQAIKKLRPFDRLEFADFILEQEGSGFTYKGLPSINFEIEKYNPSDAYRSIVNNFEEYSHCHDYSYYLDEDSKDRQLHVPMYYQYSIDKEVKTNCNNRCDTCSLDLTCSVNSKMIRGERYQFYNDDSVRLQWYHGDTLLADINYWHGWLSGPFVLYYANGKKRLEGNIKRVESCNDTVMSINAVTFYEETVIATRMKPISQGEWKYYNEQGNLTKTEDYLDPKKVKK